MTPDERATVAREVPERDVTLLREALAFLRKQLPKAAECCTSCEDHESEWCEALERVIKQVAPPAPPAPVTVTVLAVEWERVGDEWRAVEGEDAPNKADAQEFLDRIAADAERIAGLEQEIARLDEYNDAAVANTFTAQRERDEARREVESLRQGLGVAAAGGAASASDRQEPAGSAPDAPIPHGATVYDGFRVWRHYDDPDGTWWETVKTRAGRAGVTDVGEPHYNALSALWRATQPRVLTVEEVEALAIKLRGEYLRDVAIETPLGESPHREAWLASARAALAHLGMRAEEAKDA